MIGDKNPVFTVTHGRTGTTFLTRVFGIFDDTLSLHEPDPNYADVLPQVKADPRHAVAFLREKLAFIAAAAEKNYVETSNVFGKGFLIPLLRLGVAPGLVFLNRDFRQTATSLFERGSTPMRTDRGRHFSADPRVPGSLPVHAPDSLSDYQLCYWGVLDAYARQLQAAAIYRSEGRDNFIWATANDFHDFDFTLATGRRFGLGTADPQAAQRQHREIIAAHHNPNRRRRDGSERLAFSGEEAELLDRIGFLDPLFVEQALDSGFVHREVLARFGREAAA